MNQKSTGVTVHSAAGGGSTSKMHNRNRYTKKQEQRRQADRSLQQPDQQRRVLSEAEINFLLTSIVKNRVGDFGIVKLSGVDVNQLVPIPAKYRHLFQQQQEEEEQQQQQQRLMSLLEFSIKFHRDRIIHSLLRAGADPFKHHRCRAATNDADLENTVQSREASLRLAARVLAALPAAYTVWLLRLADALWLQHCQLNTAVSCVSCGMDVARTGFYVMSPCSHSFCIFCFWQSVHLLDTVARYSLHQQRGGQLLQDLRRAVVQTCCCPHCANPISIQEALSLQQQEQAAPCCINEIPAVARKAALHEHWRQLPVELDILRAKDESCGNKRKQSSIESTQATALSTETAESRHRSKRIFFQASSLTSLYSYNVMLNVGKLLTQEYITSQLIDAATVNRYCSLRTLWRCRQSSNMHTCDVVAVLQSVEQALSVRRLLAFLDQELYKYQSAELLEEHGQKDDQVVVVPFVGAKVDGINEYGQTALHVAAWLGNLPAVRLLVEGFSSDTSLCDHAGYNALQIAASAGQTHIVDYLRSYCDDSTTIPKSPHHSTIDAATTTIDCSMTNNCRAGISSIFNRSAVISSKATLHILIPQKPSAADTMVDHHAAVATDYWNRYGVLTTEAGAFCIDGAFSDSFLQQLVEFYESTPEAPTRKERCAVRSYFCDSSGNLVVRPIEQVLTVALDCLHALERSNYAAAGTAGTADVAKKRRRNAEVLPHLRFLRYKYAGGSLDLHVDLPRTDHTCFIDRAFCSCDNNSTAVDQPTVRLAGHTLAPCSTNRISTHTMILYLRDCDGHGETVLQSSQKKRPISLADGSQNHEQQPHVVEIARVEPRRGRLFLFPHNCPHEGMTVHSSDKLLLRGEIFISNEPVS